MNVNLFNRIICLSNLKYNYIHKKTFIHKTKVLKKPINISITGGAGHIGYNIAFRIASGEMLGNDQPINLSLIDINKKEEELIGLKLELEDSSFPLLENIKITNNLYKGLENSDLVYIIGVKNTVENGERVDCLKQNINVMIENGKAINKTVNKDCKVLVLANPCNTNCLIISHYANKLPKENFQAISRLDHNRAKRILADKLNENVRSITKLIIWGNHDQTMFPDIQYAEVKDNISGYYYSIKDKLDSEFIRYTFPNILSQRWKEIIKYRGVTSCASAVTACIDHGRDLFLDSNGKWVSSSVYSDGTIYSIPKDVYFSMPVIYSTNNRYNIVKDLSICDLTKEKINITSKSLLKEREIIEKYLV